MSLKLLQAVHAVIKKHIDVLAIIQRISRTVRTAETWLDAQTFLDSGFEPLV